MIKKTKSLNPRGDYTDTAKKLLTHTAYVHAVCIIYSAKTPTVRKSVFTETCICE
jgi:hypothetical protein